MGTINVIVRLEFSHVFPDEEKKNVIDYLKEISKFTLLNIIGYSNTNPQPNFDEVFSNPELKKDAIRRVIDYSRRNEIKKKPELISREASLRLTEIILQNRTELLEENENDDRDKDELNLFKAYLCINQELNGRQYYGSAEDNFEKLIDILITFSFPFADIPLYENNDKEFVKVLYCTLYKFETLLDFIKSKELGYLENGLLQYFELESLEELASQVIYLFGMLLQIKYANNYKWEVQDAKSILFLDSLVGESIIEDEDFTNLKNYPLYKISDKVYSITDYFFVVDKFFKSVRFILKEEFNKHHNLSSKDGTFFQFYNLEFSENLLMKRVLDSIYNQKYLKKKKIIENGQNEPDYYVRHNNRIYLFEHKDVLIRKDIKSSADIEKIYRVLRSKFLIEDNGRPVGIGQLVTSIKQIMDGNFEYDDVGRGVYEIYPILLVSDRIFETLGLNYRMNEWFQEMLQERFDEGYNLTRIKPLTLIDIDTLIYWLPHLSQRDKNFKDIVDSHHKRMKNRRNVSQPIREVGIEMVNKGLSLQMAPISTRYSEYKFPRELLLDKFKTILTLK